MENCNHATSSLVKGSCSPSKLRKHLGAHYTLVDTNLVDSRDIGGTVEQAQVVVIAERHSIEHFEYHRQLLDTLWQPGDIIFLEGRSAAQEAKRRGLSDAMIKVARSWDSNKELESVIATTGMIQH